ncbi:MAG TPA: transglutaminase family protein [Vicinamibacterales bacterium]|jgi:transglutaminase-like putative cysteine protease
MNRRDFLRSTLISASGLALVHPRSARAFGDDGWRTFELTTRIDVQNPAGPTRVWMPTPLTVETPYQQTLGNTFHADGGTASFTEDRAFGTGMVRAEWPEGAVPSLVVTSRVRTRDYAVDLTSPRATPRAAPAELRRFLEPVPLIPTDGIVKDAALKITRGARTDVDRARAIYEWIVDNTFRDPKVAGCGIGDIRFMLESGNLGGKCADLNALFVGLARSAGLPARDAYGVRVAKSQLGFKSLGAATEVITKSQHCRAEVHLAQFGWVPVDPADVRKVVLEEPPGNLPLDDAVVQRARARLFGAWEMNWVAYNFASNVTLPGSSRKPIGFLMYPQAETANGPLDSLNPDAFRYQITAREIAA